MTARKWFDHNGLIQLNVPVVGGGSDFEPMVLHCLVRADWIVTLHQGELDLFDEFNQPFHGDTSSTEQGVWMVAKCRRTCDAGEIDELLVHELAWRVVLLRVLRIGQKRPGHLSAKPAFYEALPPDWWQVSPPLAVAAAELIELLA